LNAVQQKAADFTRLVVCFAAERRPDDAVDDRSATKP